LLSELEKHHAEKCVSSLSSDRNAFAHLFPSLWVTLYRYHQIVASHYQHSVLDSLPDKMGGLDVRENDGTSMGQSFFSFSCFIH
jgi:hypothetical protein